MIITIVNVALKRENSREGLFLTNETNDLRCYLAQYPCIRKIQDEYLVLVDHHLPTITMNFKPLFGTAISDSNSRRPQFSYSYY